MIVLLDNNAKAGGSIVEEIWDGYLSDGTLANVDLVRGEQIPSGLYHLVCEILVKHVDGEYLLMQRDYSKPSYGGYFEATAGGSALKGENQLACCKRELQEETGIVANHFELVDRVVSIETIYMSYICITDCDKQAVTLQEGETISYKWVNEQEFIAFINSNEVIETQKKRFMPYFSKQGYILHK